MKISNRQIMQLLYIATEFRRELLIMKAEDRLSEAGQSALEGTSLIIQQINNQQSEELKEINETLLPNR